MIIFVLISFGVPLAIYFLLPVVLQILSGKHPASKIPLLIGGCLFFASWYLPSPLIQGEFTAFSTHFVGGGLFTGFLWLYIKNHLRLRLNPFYDLLGLYALVSALGVTNELWELTVSQTTSIILYPNDTWWDLLANTSGALTFWVLYYIYKMVKRFG